ncbi:hypothetical protein CONPUDRAFT_81745 [Coniophora puteana RWD-64-598 SS2]|uniref:Uncharacterized protein n=1 Tax=Coniophora puteana (strain RWD-64-598) TaxID=741705 RepID=A0A5M3MSR3_CONPW|nr:uncharacterized protein CONPUDRAFT_81745 [Coniophora puteana RWD-64-598 SS2]EIW82208.1 hypothetical protein CONPUDRAFT_81745 [Coniophora puteana RWD-64-598 SS2]
MSISSDDVPEAQANQRSQTSGIHEEEASRFQSQQAKRAVTAPLSYARLAVANSSRLRIRYRNSDKPRRVLRNPTTPTHLVVSAHGFIDHVYSSPLAYRKSLYEPGNPLLANDLVEDCCLVQASSGPILISAHGTQDRQLSAALLHDMKPRTLNRPWDRSRRAGASAVTTMLHPGMFASGGHDHRVHLWSFDDEPGHPPVAEQLSIRHTSVIHSLLSIRDTSHKLVSVGADCSTHLWDLASQRVVHSLKTSNTPYHAHKTDSPFCTLLEVAHREFQFEVRDHRMIPEHPAQRFGVYTPEFHGRFMKGDTRSHFLASGSRTGDVRLWDLRNTNSYLASVSCFGNDKVVQVIAEESHYVACSEKGDFCTIDYSIPN